MTSSEKQTDESGTSNDRDVAVPEARALAGGGAQAAAFGRAKLSRIAVATAALVLLAGWMGILYAHRWSFDPPVFFLAVGWLSVVLTARFLWQAGMSAAEDAGTADDEEFWRPAGKREELMREKQALLKAIKEIEFDHQMGKTSQEDFDELSRFYRARAIEIIKALDKSENEARALTVAQRIEQEVKARLAVDRTSAKGQQQAASKKGASKAAKQESSGSAEPASAPEAPGARDSSDKPSAEVEQ